MKVLKIGAEWCSACLVMAPRWKEIEAELPWLKTEYFEFDDSPEIVEKYGLEDGLIPTFIFLDTSGEEILRLNGEVSKEQLLETIDKYKNQ